VEASSENRGSGIHEDSGWWQRKVRNPDIESGITTARCRGREESQKDLWIGFAQ
jgi:hypothetical protein